MTRLQEIRREHFPHYDYRRGGTTFLGGSTSTGSVTCECGWHYATNEGKADAISAWREHTRDILEKESN